MIDLSNEQQMEVELSAQQLSLDAEVSSQKTELEVEAISTFRGPQGEKGDQGDIGPVGPQGERGESGVYTGTETPTDPSVKVWVNPNGDGANILLTKDAETGEFVGIPSIKGEKGDVGPIGPKGDKGDKGEPGDLDELGVLDEDEMDTLLDEGDADGTLSEQVVLGGRILQLWNRIKAAFVRLVNGVAPDADGNVKVTRAYADVVDGNTKETMYVTARVSSYGRSPVAATIDSATGEEFEIYRQWNNGQNFLQARHKTASGSLSFHKIFSDNNPPTYSDVGAAAAEHEHSQYLTSPAAVTQGGTGATNRKSAMLNLAFLGANVIASPDEDTVANWIALGTGYAWFSTNGLITDQPSQYGLVISYAHNSEVFQIWNAQPNGPMYTRSCNASGWATSWKRVFDSSQSIPVGNGGTGATTAAAARINLDITPANIGARPSTWTPTYDDVGAVKRGTYERIEGTSAAHKNLNDYRTAGFYNGKSAYVDNKPSDATSADFVLLVYPWNALPYGAQEYTETAYGNKRWIRSVDGSGNWRDWVRVYTSDAPPTYSEVGAAAASHTHDRIISGSGQVRTYTADDRIGLVGVNTTRGDSVYLFSTDVGSGLLRYITYESNARASEGTFWTSTNLKLETNGDGTELYITTS